MSWFALAIISVISISFANIFRRVAMKEKESNALASSIIFLFALAFLTGIFALINGFQLPPIDKYPINFAISAVLYAAGTLAFFHAAKKIEASEITILSSFGAIVAIIGGIIFLNESFSFVEGLGTILILISVLLVQKKLNISKDQGSLLAILGTSCYAIALISDTFIAKRSDPVSFVPVMSFLPGMILLLINPKVIKQFNSAVNKNYLKNILIYGFFYSIQAVTYYSALHAGAKASQMAPIFRAEVILTIFLAVIFLKETKRLPIKILAGIILTIGILLIK